MEGDIRDKCCKVTTGDTRDCNCWVLVRKMKGELDERGRMVSMNPVGRRDVPSWGGGTKLGSRGWEWLEKGV